MASGKCYRVAVSATALLRGRRSWTERTTVGATEPAQITLPQAAAGRSGMPGKEIQDADKPGKTNPEPWKKLR
ncbi:MAG: hypothetical protein OXF74_12620 [Rhodobacteraceae bacterium]|nr:hypothetical protein [Paracoccaceae bacterium]